MTGQMFPVSFGQQRLWFLDQLEPGTAAYNLLRVIRMEGPLDVPALSQTMQRVAERHESLRTVFVSEDGEPGQVVQSEISVELPETDLSGVPKLQQEQEVARIATEEAGRGFDLKTGP